MFNFGRQPDRVIKRGNGRRCEAEDSPQDVSSSSGNTVSPQDQYKHAQAIYEETRSPEHWAYLQRSIDRLNQ